MASHHFDIVTESIKLSRIERVFAGKLSASPTADDCANIASQMNERAQEIASGLPPDLDALPRLGGFRLRGIAMTRLETFIDAAFAFAITMLVIATQQIPDDIDTLLAAFKNVPAFVASIVVLGIFWRAPRTGISNPTILAKPVRVGAASERLIPTGEQSGLLTRIAATESVSLGVLMKS